MVSPISIAVAGIVLTDADRDIGPLAFASSRCERRAWRVRRCGCRETGQRISVPPSVTSSI